MSARVTSKIQYLKHKLVKKQENLLFWIVGCTRWYFCMRKSLWCTLDYLLPFQSHCSLQSTSRSSLPFQHASVHKLQQVGEENPWYFCISLTGVSCLAAGMLSQTWSLIFFSALEWLSHLVIASCFSVSCDWDMCMCHNWFHNHTAESGWENWDTGSGYFLFFGTGREIGIRTPFLYGLS